MADNNDPKQPTKAVVPFSAGKVAKQSTFSGIPGLNGGQGAKQPNAAMQAATGGGQTPPKRIRVVYGLDFTASTTAVVQAFQHHADSIRMAVARKHALPQYFGVFDGGGQELSQVNDARFYADRSNKAGNNNIPLFISLAISSNSVTDEVPVIIVFADGVETENSPLEDAVAKMKETDARLFFVYQDTGNGGNSPSWIKRNLIEPIGDRGVFIDISQVDKIVDLIDAMVSYAAANAQQKGTGTRQTFDQFLQAQGKSDNTLKITQGSFKQLGSGS